MVHIWVSKYQFLHPPDVIKGTGQNEVNVVVPGDNERETGQSINRLGGLISQTRVLPLYTASVLQLEQLCHYNTVPAKLLSKNYQSSKNTDTKAGAATQMYFMLFGLVDQSHKSPEVILKL